MGDYVRPYIAPATFRDADGNVIDYGNRWAAVGGEPPEDSYSIDDHPERFTPLHAVADALIDHFASHYDVDIDDRYRPTVDERRVPAARTVRAVRVTPRNEAAASLVFAFTDYPSVCLYAGLLFTGVYPSCGCNACDETWQTAADDLEWQVFTIVAGGLTEKVGKPRRPGWKWSPHGGLVRGMGQTVSYRLRSPDASRDESSTSRAEDLPAERLEKVQAGLDALAAASPDGNWQPWPTHSRR